jgi:hypothetical protein
VCPFNWFVTGAFVQGGGAVFNRQKSCHVEELGFHDLFVDNRGNLCLLCRSRRSIGRVSVNLDALNEFRQRPGPLSKKFVALCDRDRNLDIVVPLSRFPDYLKPVQPGDRYVVVQPCDLKLTYSSMLEPA